MSKLHSEPGGLRVRLRSNDREPSRPEVLRQDGNPTVLLISIQVIPVVGRRMRFEEGNSEPVFSESLGAIEQPLYYLPGIIFQLRRD